jgi:hypothetical protein
MLENIPLDAIATNLSSLSECIDLSWGKRLVPSPEMPGFHASSVSYASIQGKEWLLIRYVNYTIDRMTGAFCVDKLSGYNKIASKSFWVPVDLDAWQGRWLKFDSTEEIFDEGMSRGLEDIRVFVEDSGDVVLMGCNVDQTEKGIPQCFVAKLDIENHRIENMKILASQRMQKNWIPFPSHSFLYGWNRFNIVWGKYSEKDGSWEITQRISNIHPLLHEAKGSSTFVPWTKEGEVIGVVHTTQYEEGSSIRQYWHYLVVMNVESKEVIKYAGPFYFHDVGIEYCMGYRFDKDKLKHDFWVSRMDANPMFISVGNEKIRFCEI